jgi:sugar phosphate isomerase/epimerase
VPSFILALVSFLATKNAMFFGYNTNGLAHHDLFDAVMLLADLGYRGVAITIDHNALPPYAPEISQKISRLREMLDQLEMRSVIETGARFLLDARQKHEPTLLSEARRRRIDFYKYAIDVAAQLDSDCVSLWSGVLHEPIRQDDAMTRLVDGLSEVVEYASCRNVTIAFEPEPGMFIDSMASYETLWTRMDSQNFRLTLDIGHLQCQRETPIDAVIRQWGSRLANVHIEDMRAGVHEHLMFGEGEIAFQPILRALQDVGYADGVYVELSRHSHEGPDAARRALRFLQDAAKAVNERP